MVFTGIINHCGVIVAIDETAKGLRFTITSQFKDLVLGESIAVDGVCLTVTDFQEQVFCCDVSPETLALTTFSTFVKDTKVNLERALAVGERMGGHYVTGHVDRTAVLMALIPHAEYVELQLSGFLPQQAQYLIPKGSVCVNGVSLTINNVLPGPVLSLMLIPHTLAVTNLSDLIVGKRVNIEFDYHAKVIAHQLALHAKQKELQDVT